MGQVCRYVLFLQLRLNDLFSYLPFSTLFPGDFLLAVQFVTRVESSLSYDNIECSIFPFVKRIYGLSSTTVRSKTPIAVSLCGINCVRTVEKVRCSISQKVTSGKRIATAVTKFRSLPRRNMCAIFSGENIPVCQEFHSFSKRYYAKATKEQKRRKREKRLYYNKVLYRKHKRY